MRMLVPLPPLCLQRRPCGGSGWPHKLSLSMISNIQRAGIGIPTATSSAKSYPAVHQVIVWRQVVGPSHLHLISFLECSVNMWGCYLYQALICHNHVLNGDGVCEEVSLDLQSKGVNGGIKPSPCNLSPKVVFTQPSTLLVLKSS